MVPGGSVVRIRHASHPGIGQRVGSGERGVQTGEEEGRADYQSQHSVRPSPPHEGLRHVDWDRDDVLILHVRGGVQPGVVGQKEHRRALQTLTVDDLRPC